MKLERQPDGCLCLVENWTVTRWALAIGAVLVPVAVAFSQMVSGEFGVFGLLGGGAGALGMLGVAAAISDLEVSFDTRLRVMHWEQRSWIRQRHLEVPFKDIRNVYVSSSSTRTDDTTVGGYNLTHKLMMATDMGMLPITMSEGSDMLAYEALRQQVLGLLAPHAIATELSAPIERLVAEGRLIDATAAIRAERGVDLATARKIVDAMRCQNGKSRTNGGSAVDH